MTAAELIAELQKYPANAEVILKELVPVQNGTRFQLEPIIREKLVNVMRYSENDYKDEETKEFVLLGFCNIQEWDEIMQQ